MNRRRFFELASGVLVFLRLKPRSETVMGFPVIRVPNNYDKWQSFYGSNGIQQDTIIITADRYVTLMTYWKDPETGKEYRSSRYGFPLLGCGGNGLPGETLEDGLRQRHWIA